MNMKKRLTRGKGVADRIISERTETANVQYQQERTRNKMQFSLNAKVRLTQDIDCGLRRLLDAHGQDVGDGETAARLLA